MIDIKIKSFRLINENRKSWGLKISHSSRENRGCKCISCSMRPTGIPYTR